MNNISRRNFLGYLASLGILYLNPYALAKKIKNFSSFENISQLEWPNGYSSDFSVMLNKTSFLIASQSGDIGLITNYNKKDIAFINCLKYNKILDVKSFNNNQAYILHKNELDAKVYLSILKLKNKTLVETYKQILPIMNLSEFLSMDVNSQLICLAYVNQENENCLFINDIRSIFDSNLSKNIIQTKSKINTVKIFNKEIAVLYETNDPKLELFKYHGSIEASKFNTTNLDLDNINFMDIYKDRIVLANTKDSSSSQFFILKEVRNQNFNVIGKFSTEGDFKVAKLTDREIEIFTKKNILLNLYKFNYKGNCLSNTSLNSAALALTNEDFNNLYLTNNNTVILNTPNYGLFEYNTTNNSTTTLYNPHINPSTSLTVNNKDIIIGSNQLMYYNLNNKNKLNLRFSHSSNSPIQDIYSIDNDKLLIKDINSIKLVKLNNPETVINEINNNYSHLCFDKANKIYYGAIFSKDSINIQSLNCVNENLNIVKNYSTLQFKSTQNISKLYVHNNYLAILSLHTINIYGIANDLQLLASYSLKDFAIRDICFNDEYMFISCLDKDINSFIKVALKDSITYKEIASINLKHDGMAIYVHNNNLFSTGKDSSGQDILSVYDITSAQNINLAKNLKTVNCANKLLTDDNFLYVAGLGLQVVSL